MKEENTPIQSVNHLIIKTIDGTRILSPERIVYLGYRTVNNEGRREHSFEVAYVPNAMYTLRVERLLHRSMNTIPIPEGGQLLRVHRKAYVNLNYVEGFNKGFELLFSLPEANGLFRVGRTFRKAFKAAFGIG